MPTETIYCPSCNNKLRVPDDLMGQEVQCPKCQSMFFAPPPPAVLPVDHPEAPARRLPTRQVGGDDDFDRWDDEPRRPRASSGRRKGAGITLLLVGSLQIVMNLYGLSIALFNPDELRKQFQQLQAMFPMAAGGPQFDPVKLQLIANVAFLLVSIVQTVGAGCLLKGRFYPLALIGAFLAVVNCNQACCLIGVPAGIWALVVLFDANVKAEFV